MGAQVAQVGAQELTFSELQARYSDSEEGDAGVTQIQAQQPDSVLAQSGGQAASAAQVCEEPKYLATGQEQQGQAEEDIDDEWDEEEDELAAALEWADMSEGARYICIFLRCALSPTPP